MGFGGGESETRVGEVGEGHFTEDNEVFEIDSVMATGLMLV